MRFKLADSFRMEIELVDGRLRLMGPWNVCDGEDARAYATEYYFDDAEDIEQLADSLESASKFVRGHITEVPND
jgi:hypothetical protein